MKKLDLEKKLRALGWQFVRHGGRHDVWSDASGSRETEIPRHREIGEGLAAKILNIAKGVKK